LEIVSGVIGKLKEAVRPFTQEILDKLFQLWQSSNEKNTTMVKAALLQVVSSLVS
jgi:hypothetical protein